MDDFRKRIETVLTKYRTNRRSFGRGISRSNPETIFADEVGKNEDSKGDFEAALGALGGGASALTVETDTTLSVFDNVSGGSSTTLSVFDNVSGGSDAALSVFDNVSGGDKEWEDASEDTDTKKNIDPDNTFTQFLHHRGRPVIQVGGAARATLTIEENDGQILVTVRPRPREALENPLTLEN